MTDESLEVGFMDWMEHCQDSFHWHGWFHGSHWLILHTARSIIP
jgi:hypothetical protein